jgi:alkyl hydroperoxide reductase subunit AhpF
MALISAKDQQMLRDLFAERMQQDVTITYFTQRESVLIVPGQECTYCKETRELLGELADLSNKLHLEIKDFVRDEAEARQLGVSRIPAFVLSGQNKGRVRYFGIPAGYEFSTVVEDLLNVSTGAPDLLNTTQQALAGLQQDLHIQVFVTPT